MFTRAAISLYKTVRVRTLERVIRADHFVSRVYTTIATAAAAWFMDVGLGDEINQSFFPALFIVPDKL